jgi:hypothetical protein
MKIIFRHKELDYEVAIATPHDDPDKTFPLETDDGILKRDIGEGYGFYGHSIDIDNISNLDLQAVGRKLSSFEVVSVEPTIAPHRLPKGVLS